jgi:hypothetical protein
MMRRKFLYIGCHSGLDPESRGFLCLFSLEKKALLIEGVPINGLTI